MPKCGTYIAQGTIGANMLETHEANITVHELQRFNYLLECTCGWQARGRTEQEVLEHFNIHLAARRKPLFT